MLTKIDTDLSLCNSGLNGQTKDYLKHKVYWTSRDNEHRIPNVAANNNVLDPLDTNYALPIPHLKNLVGANADRTSPISWW